jgi:hypothetical protein
MRVLIAGADRVEPLLKLAGEMSRTLAPPDRRRRPAARLTRKWEPRRACDLWGGGAGAPVIAGQLERPTEMTMAVNDGGGPAALR